MIKPREIEIYRTNTESLRNAKPPNTKMKLRLLLCLCNVYHRFIRDFAELAQPLNRIIKKGQPDKFDSNKEKLESFKKFIDFIISAPVLALPIPDLPYWVRDDVSE